MACGAGLTVHAHFASVSHVRVCSLKAAVCFELCLRPTTYYLYTLLVDRKISSNFGSRTSPIVIDSGEDSKKAEAVSVPGSPLKVVYNERYR